MVCPVAQEQMSQRRAKATAARCADFAFTDCARFPPGPALSCANLLRRLSLSRANGEEEEASSGGTHTHTPEARLPDETGGAPPRTIFAVCVSLPLCLCASSWRHRPRRELQRPTTAARPPRSPVAVDHFCLRRERRAHDGGSRFYCPDMFTMSGQTLASEGRLSLRLFVLPTRASEATNE